MNLNLESLHNWTMASSKKDTGNDHILSILCDSQSTCNLSYRPTGFIFEIGVQTPICGRVYLKYTPMGIGWKLALSLVVPLFFYCKVVYSKTSARLRARLQVAFNFYAVSVYGATGYGATGGNATG
jgi:hypothetical protein